MSLNTAEDIKEMLKGDFQDSFEGALKAKLDEHMGYEKNEPSNKIE